MIYKLDEDGLIENECKFQYLPYYAPYFYALVQEGLHDNCWNDYNGIKITKEHKEVFSDLKNYDYIVMIEDLDGTLEFEIYEDPPERCLNPICEEVAVIGNEVCLSCGKSVEQVNAEWWDYWKDMGY